MRCDEKMIMHKEIDDLQERYERERWRRKKDVDSVITEYQEGLTLLEAALKAWESSLFSFQELVDNIAAKEWKEHPQKVTDILTLVRQLLDSLSITQKAILLPCLEHDQREIVSGMGKLLDSMMDLLSLHPGVESHIAHPDMFCESLAMMLASNEHKLSQCENSLETTRREASKKGRQDGKPPGRALKRRLSNSRTQLSLLAIGLPLLYSTNWWLPIDTLRVAKLVAKLLICCVTLLWFPSQFLPSSRHQHTVWIVYALLWSFCTLPWVYGLRKGIPAAILLALPVVRLLSTRKADIDRSAQRTIERRVYRTSGLSLLAVGAFVTRENLWIIGTAIWWTFTAVSRLSFRHFRFTFDMIDALTPDRDSALVKRRLIYFALLISALTLISGLLGRLHRESVVNLYRQAANTSFGLMAILFGVQAIVPSITSWGGKEKQSRTPSEVREMKLLLRNNQGLVGFLQIFFIVFLMSVVGIASASFLSETYASVDLSLSFLTMPTASIVDYINPWIDFQYSAQTTVIFIQTVFFTVLVCLFSYSLASLYYLFIATNALMLPIRDALLSQPIHIESSQVYLKKDRDDLLDDLTQRLRHARKLRGEVIAELTLAPRENGSAFCSVTINGDFYSKTEVVDKTMALLDGIFAVEGIGSARVIIVKTILDARGRTKLLSLEVTRPEFDFLKCDIEDMDTEYKLVQVGAHIRRGLLPESQIL